MEAKQTHRVSQYTDLKHGTAKLLCRHQVGHVAVSDAHRLLRAEKIGALATLVLDLAHRLRAQLCHTGHAKLAGGKHCVVGKALELPRVGVIGKLFADLRHALGRAVRRLVKAKQRLEPRLFGKCAAVALLGQRHACRSVVSVGLVAWDTR